MYRCDNCNTVSKSKESLYLVVVETRAVAYKDKAGNTFATGTEIVREEKRCASCK